MPSLPRPAIEHFFYVFRAHRECCNDPFAYIWRPLSLFSRRRRSFILRHLQRFSPVYTFQPDLHFLLLPSPFSPSHTVALPPNKYLFPSERHEDSPFSFLRVVSPESPRAALPLRYVAVVVASWRPAGQNLRVDSSEILQ